MEKITDLREMLYPAEWCIRFSVIALLLLILAGTYPNQPTISLIYYASVVGVFFGLLLQFTYVWSWYKK